MAGKGKGKKARRKWLMIGGLLVVLVTASSISMYKRSKISGSMEKITVKSEIVSTGNISNAVSGSGNIEVANTVNVTIPTGIKVKTVLVESGDVVTKGHNVI